MTSRTLCGLCWLFAALLLLTTVSSGAEEGELDSSHVTVASRRIKPRGEQQTAEPLWSDRIAAVDAGSKSDAWAKPTFDDRDWKAMKLPTHWENAGLPDYDGVVWFRKVVTLPPGLAGKRGTLRLGPIDDMDVTWVNGVRVGGYEEPGSHNTPRQYIVPEGTLIAGDNVIAIRVMDHGWPGGIFGKPEQMHIEVSGQMTPLAGSWRYRKGADLATLQAVTVSSATARKNTSFTGRFELNDDDVIVFTGGSDVAKQATNGYLESILTIAAADNRVYFRNTAWQADTVYRQQRPRNFGTHLDELQRVNATIVVASFGQMESLDGVERLPAFIEAYEELLEQFAQQTQKIVLVTPIPFEQLGERTDLPDLTTHNDAVALYAKAIRELATRRGYLTVDLAAFRSEGLTTDGIHLNGAGHWQLALEMTDQLLDKSPASSGDLNSRGVFTDAKFERLRQAILAKNVLWQQLWRPTNWSFAYGNRTHVASSHDHRPGLPRWFPTELDGIIPKIEQAEDQLLQLR
ncbi:MAG: beta galactosidase jelly roll domain-containing protein [Planctomycetes bacterium]|nr:beta galactosidase jelly roll domain-containing protein [Planctomycetota bacterium]